MAFDLEFHIHNLINNENHHDVEGVIQLVVCFLKRLQQKFLSMSRNMNFNHESYLLTEAVELLTIHDVVLLKDCE